MAQFMMGNGIKIRLMETAFISLIMATDMKENSTMASRKVMERCFIEMEIHIKVSGRMANFGVTVSFILRTETTMKDSSLMGTSRVRV